MHSHDYSLETLAQKVLLYYHLFGACNYFSLFYHTKMHQFDESCHLSFLANIVLNGTRGPLDQGVIICFPLASLPNVCSHIRMDANWPTSDHFKAYGEQVFFPSLVVDSASSSKVLLKFWTYSAQRTSKLIRSLPSYTLYRRKTSTFEAYSLFIVSNIIGALSPALNRLFLLAPLLQSKPAFSEFSAYPNSFPLIQFQKFDFKSCLLWRTSFFIIEIESFHSICTIPKWLNHIPDLLEQFYSSIKPSPKPSSQNRQIHAAH